jgi:hypothetical protein
MFIIFMHRFQFLKRIFQILSNKYMKSVKVCMSENPAYVSENPTPFIRL